MFIKKSQKEISEMTDEQADIYVKGLEAHNAEVQKLAIEKAIEPINDTLKNTSKGLDDANETIKQLQESAKAGLNVDSYEVQLKNFLTENIDKIKGIQAAGSGMVEFTMKAVADITTSNGTNTTPPNTVGTDLAPLQNVNLREMQVLNLTTNINTSAAAFPYTESVPKDGDYTFVAEGAAKPQIDFTWETNYAKPVKAAAWIRLTEEAIQDVKGLESVAKDYLFKKHNLFKAKAILFGTGVAPQPKGATVYGRVFSAGALALAVPTPNFMDVVNAAITDIATTHNYTDELDYRANLVLVNPNDFFINLVSAKDTQGHPLYPTASLFNQVNIGGVTIIPETSIPVGKIFVADMGMYHTTNYMPYTVKIGYVNDDFIKNQFVMLGESRFHAFVKKLDAQAFIYDDIDTIKTAITKA
jgi:hypothetical protein